MHMVEEIMSKIADEGNAVIVGRGAPFFLRERKDTFSVFTYAPYEEKIRSLLEMGKSREEARDLVDNVDKERIAYVKHYFNADRPTRSLYHMMINTVVGNENVINAILTACKCSSLTQPKPRFAAFAEFFIVRMPAPRCPKS